jgi:hypothetical protein
MRTLTGRGRRAPPPTGRARDEQRYGPEPARRGAIMMAVGILGLLLPAVAQRPRHDVHSAASGDVTGLREDGRLVDPNGPGRQRDEQ